MRNVKRIRLDQLVYRFVQRLVLRNVSLVVEEARLDIVLEFGFVLDPDFLEKFLVHLRSADFPDIGHFHLEIGGLAAILFILVVGRIDKVNVLVVALLHAGKAFVKSRRGGFAEKRTELAVFRNILRFAVDIHFDIVADNNVALFGFAIDGFRGRIHLQNAVEFRLDFIFGDRHFGNGNSEALVALDIDFRIDFDNRGKRDVSVFVILEIFDLDAGNRDDVRLFQLFAQRAVHQFLDAFLANHLAKTRNDRMARSGSGAETFQLHFLAVLRHLLLERSLQRFLGNGDFDIAYCRAGFFNRNCHVVSNR